MGTILRIRLLKNQIRAAKMAKKIDPNEPLTKLELDIVFMRYFQDMCNPEVAERLGLKLNQVKYRINKPNVKRYIREEILPYKRRQIIAKLLRVPRVVPIIAVNVLILAVILVFSFLAIVSITLFP